MKNKFVNQSDIARADSILASKHPTRDQRRLANAIKFLSIHQQPYTGDFSVIDPSGHGVILAPLPLDENGRPPKFRPDALEYDPVHVLYKKEEPFIDRIMTLDIEAFSLYPDIASLLCIYDPENPDRQGLIIEKVTHLDPEERLVGARLLQPLKDDELGNPADYTITGTWHDQYQYKRYEKGPKKGQLKRDHRGELIVERVKPGMIEVLENKIISLPTGKDTPTIRIDCLAHNGKRYDWKGLADEIMSNWEIDPIFEVKDQPGCFANPETGEITSASKRAKYFRDPKIARFLRTKLWASGTDSAASSLIRRRTVKKVKGKNGEYEVEITNGVGESVYLIWKLKPCGGDYFIEVSISGQPNHDGGKKHRLRLLDSVNHLTASLKMMGAKGKTPEMFTDPPKWMGEEIRKGNVSVSGLSEEEKKDVLMAHWRKCAMSKENIYYVKQDCKILYDALKSYQGTYGDIVRHPADPNIPINPLSFLTSAQASLAAMIILSEASHDDTMGNGYAVAHFPQNGSESGVERNPKQALISNPRKLADLTEKGYPVRSVPFFPGDEASVCYGGWYQYGKYCQMMIPASFGGRTEVFQIKTRNGYRKVSIDKNSMYPSVMGNDSLFFANPKFLRPLEQPIRGKAAIQEHLRGHSGVYRIIVDRPLNPIIHEEFPIFPIRLANTDYESRAVYASWEQPIDILVTGEELRYFLEMTDVKDDNIEILVEGTCYSNLVPARKAPFYHFAKRFYGLRQKSTRAAKKWAQRAREAWAKGDRKYAERCEREEKFYESRSLFAKMQLVSGGFGVLLQKNTENHYLVEGQDLANKEKLQLLMSMSPDWDGWDRLTDEGVKVDSKVEMTKGKVEGFGSQEALRLAESWAVDHYISKDWDNVDRGQNGEFVGVIKRLLIRLPKMLSPHALPAFGVAITAHARVDLHRALMTVRDIPSFRVLYCDTDSVHFEVPESMSDDEVAKHLQRAKVNRGEGEEPQIKLGDDLGEWKIEPVKVNRDLVDPQDPDIDLGNVAAIYLAPKLYMITSQPKKDANGRVYHQLYKETVKGIHQYSTPMRVALQSMFVNEAKLGDHKMASIGIRTAVDLIQGIESGQNLRRIYGTDIESPSKPLVIRQARETLSVRKARERQAAGIETGEAEYTVKSYMRDVANETLRQAKPFGIREGVRYYLDRVRVKNESVADLRKRVIKEIDRFNLEEFDSMDKGGLIRANAMLERLKKTTLASKRDPKEQIAGGFDTTIT